MSMIEKNDDILENFELHKDEKYIPKKQNIEKNFKNLIYKSLDTRSYTKNGISDIFLKMSFL